MRKYILFSVVITLLVCSVTVCPAQQSSDQKQDADVSVQGDDVSTAQKDRDQVMSETLSSQPTQEAKPITAIEVKGNKAISTNTIISKMKTRVGIPYQENIVSDD